MPGGRIPISPALPLCVAADQQLHNGIRHLTRRGRRIVVPGFAGHKAFRPDSLGRPGHNPPRVRYGQRRAALYP
jgi:hypothetical protein